MLEKIILVILVTVAAITDIKRKEIDNELIAAGLACGLLLSALGWSGLTFVQSALGFLVGGGVFLVLALVSNLGGGDVKLMAVIGYYAGWFKVLLIMSYASVFGGIIALALLLLKKVRLKDELPLAPAIALATFYVLHLFG